MTIFTRTRPRAMLVAQTDQNIIAAWKSFAGRQWAKLNSDDPENDTVTIVDTPAETLAGVIAKLRMLMFTQTAIPLIEATALGATIPGFDESIRGEDYLTELVWSAIKDLEAMEARS
ncbi:hypothetical protein [Sphingobium chungbukense]|uniref:Uncharacterized protein n=1 Tax=Sphingobium chungbukense TaxID=56193 RepID=A0A0M3AUQ7_9SPHN|nr:hypothetical protein [Sphingobium chungbukense]KKW92269.1 hypothetical protein YP76_10080 [Sphingobium chungbukense]